MWISISAKEKSNKKERKGMGYAHNLMIGFPRHKHHGIYQAVFNLDMQRKMIYSCTINCSTTILFSLQTGTYIGGYLILWPLDILTSSFSLYRDKSSKNQRKTDNRKMAISR